MNFNIIPGLSLTRILSGISKSLSLIGQIKPIYNNVKPLFKYLPNYNNYLYTETYNKEENNTKENTISFFN